MEFTETPIILERPADATRQYIDATATFTAYEEAMAESTQLKGGMYWHRGSSANPENSYLIRTSAAGSEKSLGPRSPETEAIYTAFRQKKEASEQRLAGLSAALTSHQRMNRALRVGRVAPIVIDILNRLATSRLDAHFRIVGTHALYAYEAAAGVIFDGNTVATRDIDLLWDVRKRISFATALKRVDSSMLGVLQKVDPSFRVRQSQKYTAVNKDGFEVDIIRRLAILDDPHPVRLSDSESDFWAIPAPRAQTLLDTELFSAVIVASNGAMARMNTIPPSTFVRFKQWMSELPDRDPGKRRRDKLQARAVEHVLQEYLPHLTGH